MQKGAVNAYYAYLVHAGLWSSEAAARRYVPWVFRGVPLDGVRLLDVGGGAGVFTAYAALHGATVTCIEPVGAGSDERLVAQFDAMAAALGVQERATLVRATLQDYDGGPFDVVLIHNAVNHLSEVDVVNLHRNGEGDRSREVYRELFRKLAGMMSPGGHLIVTDCARRNLWPMLGLRHPLQSQIEWHKHHQPELWAKLLAEAGFTAPRVSWSSFNRLGRLGWLLLANRAGAFVATGHFRLHMRRP